MQSPMEGKHTAKNGKRMKKQEERRPAVPLVPFVSFPASNSYRIPLFSCGKIIFEICFERIGIVIQQSKAGYNFALIFFEIICNILFPCFHTHSSYPPFSEISLFSITWIILPLNPFVYKDYF